ncbi:MAG: HAD hydrolase-like protein, partial [Defluviitaleaceae bacterium]|nr:HAD hydrolase-like protein [Defluviitaleaceae bacterium]
MIDICLFDLDGTLTDSRRGIENCIFQALGHFGIDTAKLDIAPFLGPPLRDSFRAAGIRKSDIEAAVAKYRELYTAGGMFENSVFPGIVAVLDALRAADIMLTVATSKATVYAEKILAHFDIAKYFHLIVGCELDGRRSEKPEIIAHTFDLLGISSGENIIMIGDRRQDIAGAAAAGIPSIAALWGYSTPGEFDNC